MWIEIPLRVWVKYGFYCADFITYTEIFVDLFQVLHGGTCNICSCCHSPPQTNTYTHTRVCAHIYRFILPKLNCGFTVLFHYSCTWHEMCNVSLVIIYLHLWCFCLPVNSLTSLVIGTVEYFYLVFHLFNNPIMAWHCGAWEKTWEKVWHLKNFLHRSVPNWN